jgi:hypothetical protein
MHIVKPPPPVVGALTWLAVLGAAVFADPKKGAVAEHAGDWGRATGHKSQCARSHGAARVARCGGPPQRMCSMIG